MSEENQVTKETETTPETKDAPVTPPVTTPPDASELSLMKRQQEADRQELATMREHMNKLLGEKKAEQSKREEAENKRLKESGEWKQLHDDQEKKRKEAVEDLNKYKADTDQREISQVAFEAASTIADGANIKFISDRMIPLLKKVDGNIKSVDPLTGQLSIQTMEEFTAGFANNPDFKSLVRGNQSKGGSALGSSRGTVASTEMKRSDWDKLDIVEQRKFIVTDKGKLV